jgi:hypothetical protein
MKRSANRRWAAVPVLLSVVVLGGCSTISGAADFIGGIARDVKDAAEGARDRSGASEYDGVYHDRTPRPRRQ